MLGKNGVETVVEIALSAEEKRLFTESFEHVKALVDRI